MPEEDVTPGSKTAVQKKDVKVDPAVGSVPIAELFKDPESFEGKAVRVRGEVTRYNPDIMGRNWIHLQDGTNFSGNFDLTITSQDIANTDEIATFEGLISLNKNFGSGYFYELIMEDAIKIDTK